MGSGGGGRGICQSERDFYAPAIIDAGGIKYSGGAYVHTLLCLYVILLDSSQDFCKR